MTNFGLWTNNTQYCRISNSSWSVKEAMIKASGKRLLFPEMQYTKSQIGAPLINVYGQTKQWIENDLKVSNIHVSVSHDDGYTLAMVVLESNSDS